LILGSSGLFLIPFVLGSLFSLGGSSWFGHGSALVNVAASGVLDGADALLRPAFRGSPLVWSALLPVALTGLLYGVSRFRGALAGFGFGVAGALLFAAISSTFDVRAIPDVLDRPWLVANAMVSALVATAVLRR
jgi:hypothetical protein